MIKDIVEVNFPSYATLHQASVSIQEMGDRTITTQVKIDGSVIPDFSYDWEILFKGERYIHPIREPQAAKDNTSFNSTIEMVFQHWAIYQLKRYYFMEMTSVEAGTAIADKYEASLALTLPKFVDAFNNVLSYYFGDKIVMILNDAATYEEAPQFIEIKYSHIWEVLTSIYDTYAVRWNIVYNAHLDRYEIRVGFESEVSVDHIFEYGFNGGLLKFERAVQNTDLANILLGRGGEKNLPTWYFKNPALFTEGGDNELFNPDPDAIPELKDVVFTELRGWTFRMYVRGWMTNQHRIKTLYKKDGSVLWSAGTLPSRDETLYETNWAYRKGCDDLKFNPPEYVKSENSIEQYGEIWGSLDNNTEIFPSIQGVEVSPYGRIDEVIDVEEVTTDDIESMAAAAVVTNVKSLYLSTWMPRRSETDGGAGYKTFKQGSRAFSVPEGKVGSLTANFHIESSAVNTGIILLASKSILIVKNAVTGEVLPNAQSIPAGHYYYRWEITLYNPSETGATVTIGTQGVKLTTSDVSNMAWKPTFDIWVKNIFNTHKGEFETEDAYVERVWLPILGSRGEEAAVTFATGWLSGHEDWDFTIVGNIFNGIHYDTSKARDGIHSEWRITLQKSDAELDATGKYIPYVGFNAHSGDRFFFTGIDMPFEYVFWAEQRLDTYKMESLSDSAHIHPTWSVQLDKVRTNLFDSEYGKKLVDALSAGALIHIRDHRFTKGDVLNLYIQRIAYTWNEGMDIPNVELTLSDTIYVSQSNSERMQSQINALQRDYISISTVEDTVKTIVARSYLSKTQQSDTSFTQTAFAAPIISDNFEQGRSGGSGWGVYKDGDRASVIEADKIIVRQKLDVNELVVNQISAAGGKQIVSAANMECTQVVDSPDGYICYFDQKRGSVGNTFAMHDIAMGQRFDTTNAESWYYKREVVGLGENYIVLSKTNCSSGADVPREGDIIIQMGNLYDIDRQAAHVIAAYGPNAPSYTMFADLDGFNTEGKDVFGVEYRAVEGSQTNFTSLEADDFEESGGDSVVFGSGKREPFFYNYGSMLLGDRNQQNGFILYDNPTKTLRISAEVHFLPTSTGLEGLPKWQELSGKVDELQSQVDGAIETWFADGEPTLNNYPASEWETDTERNNHLGDLYYSRQTGKAYRFSLSEDGVHSWVYIADNDIAKALKDAEAALSAANSAIKGVDVEYAVNDSGTSAPEEGWYITAPAREVGQYLWQRTKTTTNDGTQYSIPVCISGIDGAVPTIVKGHWWIGGIDTGIQATGDTPEIGANGNWWIGDKDTGYPARGEDGNSITDVEEYYGVSTNATTRPTLWDSTVPSNYGENYPYLWNYEKIHSSKMDAISTTPAIIGVYGADGNGVERIVEHYQISESKTVAPTTWSDTFIAPTTEKPFLWNYETVYYTKGSPVDTAPAIVGAAGASVASVEELYYLSINAFAPAAPTALVTEERKLVGTWTKTCPDWVNGYTYFVCSQIIRTDGTFEFTDVMSAGNIKTHTFYTAEGEYPRPPYNKGDYWICASYNDGGAASAAISQVEDGNMAVDIEEGGFAANDGPISDSAGNDLGYELAVVAADTTGGVSYTNEILVCINSKASGESFSINDWQPAGDYAKNSDYDYLRAALPRTEAVINGGLILGSFIGVSNAQGGSVSEGNIVAGMAGVAGANDEFRQITDPTTGSSRQLLIFAGVTGDASDLNRYKTAAVQIWSDGYFVAQSGVIGGLTVSNDGISYAPNEGSSPTMYIRRDSCLLPNAQIEGCVQTKMTGDGDQSFISLAQANGRPMLRINASNLTGNAPDTMLYLHHGSTIFNVNPGGWFTTLNIDAGFDILSRTLPTTNGTLVIPSFKLKFGCHDVSRTIQYQVKVVRFTAGTTGVDTAYQYNSGSFSSNGSHEFIIPQYTLEVEPFYEYGLAVYVQGAIHSGLGNTAYLNCYVDENTIGRISYGSSNIQPGCFIGANGLDFTMGPQQKFQYITTPVAVLNGNIRRDGRNSGGQFEISLTANDENQIGLKGNGNLDAAGSVVGAAMYINLGSGWRKLKIENNHLMVE